MGKEFVASKTTDKAIILQKQFFMIVYYLCEKEIIKACADES